MFPWGSPRRNGVLFRRCVAATRVRPDKGVAPSGFDWATCVSRQERQEVLATVVPKFLTFSAVLIFCDITDDDQFQGLLEIVYHMDGEQDAPPLFCVHMMPTGETVAMSTNSVERADVALVVGLQDLIVGCRRGLSLVHQCRASVCREQRVMSVLKAKLDERREALHQNSLTRFYTNAILWHDFRQRMRLAIPLVDYELEETDSDASVNGIHFGDVLMSGCWGWKRHAKFGDESECKRPAQMDWTCTACLRSGVAVRKGSVRTVEFKDDLQFGQLPVRGTARGGSTRRRRLHRRFPWQRDSVAQDYYST